MGNGEKKRDGDKWGTGLLLQPELGHGMMAVYLNEANTGTFVDYSCQRTATNTASLVLASVKKGAECLASACIALSTDSGVC